MGEARAIAITVASGLVGMLVGSASASVINVAWAALPVDAPEPSIPMIVLGVAGVVLGPAIALQRAGVDLPKVTAGLAAVWVFLLTVSVGPLLSALGASWFPFGVALAALVIARTIAGPFVPYIVARPTAVATASR